MKGMKEEEAEAPVIEEEESTTEEVVAEEPAPTEEVVSEEEAPVAEAPEYTEISIEDDVKALVEGEELSEEFKRKGKDNS